MVGPRQAGKTTLLKEKYHGLNYFGADAREVCAKLEKTPAVAWGGQIGDAIIDEVQRAKTAVGKTRFAFDQGHVGLSALVGSVDFLSIERNLEQLSTRADIFELWPLMLCELAGAESAMCLEPLFSSLLECGGSLNRALASRPPTKQAVEELPAVNAFNHLARWGGMPTLVNMSEGDRGRWLRDYWDRFIRLDLGDHARHMESEPLRRFSSAVASRAAQACSYTDLALEAGSPVSLVRTYLKHLKTAFQIFELEPYSFGAVGSKEKNAKIIWADIGILRSLSDRDLSSSLLFKNLVASELIKWIRTMRAGARVHFFRAGPGFDADLLLETQNGVLGVRIQNREGAAAEDLEALTLVANAAKSRWLGGIVVTRGRTLRMLNERCSAWEVPVTRLLVR